jgi:GAF domain-containing protein
MAEQLIFTGKESRREVYSELLPQLKALTNGETDIIANLANISAALKEAFGFFWVGFYIVNHNELVLGPFQGSIACTRIRKGRGVCGTAWEKATTIVVPDVEKFPGHIACSSLSKSEIVVPVMVKGTVKMVLDVDSDTLNDFGVEDVEGLNGVVDLISAMF